MFKNLQQLTIILLNCHLNHPSAAMTLIDTHAHLYLEDFATDRTLVLERALFQGVQKIFLPNIDSRSVENLLQLEKEFPAHCFAMMGLHPCSVNEQVEQELKIVSDWLAKRKFAGLGEIGLDFYWDRTYTDQQLHAFRTQIQWALQYQLPISIHSRNATKACIEMVQSMQNGRLKGIFHCFSGTVEEAKKIIDLNFYLGIGGVITFKNAGLDKVIEQVDLRHLVLETDAPYLAPVPYRGKRNESSYLRLIAEKIAAIKQVSVEEVAAVSTENAAKVFD